MMPILIQGDSNRVPKNLSTIKTLIVEEAWVDLSAVASWWGGKDEEETRQAHPKAKATRIDGVVANLFALPMVKKSRSSKTT